MRINGNLQFLGLGEVQNLRVENLTADPVSPTLGQVWYNSTEGKYKGFDGTQVVAFATGGNTAILQAELDATQAAAGLTAAGAYVADATTNYITTATTLVGADKLLDAQLKVVTDGLAAAVGAAGTEATDRAAADAALQAELDATQAGAGLSVAGAYVPDASTNFVKTAVSLADADKKLDAEIKSTLDLANTKVDRAGDTLTGSLNFNGVQTVTGLRSPSAADDAATKNYVDSLVSGLSWKQAVDAVLADHTTFPTPTAGNRVLNTTDGKIYTRGASSWSGVTAADGDAVFNRADETGYVFSGAQWVQFTGTGQVAAGIGLVKVGNQIDVNLGAGITELPEDGVAVDVRAASGLFLTVDGVATSSDSAAQLAIKLDGATLKTTAAGIAVNEASIGPAQLAAAVAGNGLVGGAGQALDVNVGTGIKIVADAVTLDQDVTDALYVNVTGDTLTGPLVLAADPVAALGAAPKQYVDAVAAKVASGVVIYDGAVAATSFTVPHALGTKFANVTVYDAADEVILPRSITALDANNVVVTFNTAIACTIVVVGKKA